jgi:serine/threonine protein kinase
LQDFEIQKKLGEGAFGQVFVVKRKLDNHVYAFKKVKLLGMKDKEK